MDNMLRLTYWVFSASRDKQVRKMGYLQSAQRMSTGTEPCSCSLHTPSLAHPLVPQQNSPSAAHKHCNQFTSIRFKEVINVSWDHNLWSDDKVLLSQILS